MESHVSETHGRSVRNIKSHLYTNDKGVSEAEDRQEQMRLASLLKVKKKNLHTFEEQEENELVTDPNFENAIPSGLATLAKIPHSASASASASDSDFDSDSDSDLEDILAPSPKLHNDQKEPPKMKKRMASSPRLQIHKRSKKNHMK